MENPFGMFDPSLWTKMWSECAAKMTQAGGNLSPQAMPPEAMRSLRGTMLEAWSQSWDQFMRSPQFLEMMRQSMAGSVQWRKQMNDMMGNMQHQFQGASRQDIDEIMLGLRHLEQRMVDAVEDLSSRLDDLAVKFEPPEEGTAGNGVAENHRRRRSPPSRAKPRGR